MNQERQDTFHLKACPTLCTSPSKASLPKSPQTASVSEIQGCRYNSLWRTFSFQPLPCTMQSVWLKALSLKPGTQIFISESWILGQTVLTFLTILVKLSQESLRTSSLCKGTGSFWATKFTCSFRIPRRKLHDCRKIKPNTKYHESALLLCFSKYNFFFVCGNTIYMKIYIS